MSIKIISPSELNAEQSLVTVIYGQPGIGKTTLAATAEKPLLFDFDSGIQRAAIQCDIVPCRTWSEVATFKPADVDGYKTLIIDTGGQCVNALKRDIIASDPRMATNSGSLTLNGYGVLKDRFSDFVARIRATEKDLVIVMHATEQKDGDSVSLRLDVAGGSKDEIHRVADVMGLLRLDNRCNRQLVLTPTLAGYAKNPVGLDQVRIAAPGDNPNTMAELLAMIRKGMAVKFGSKPEPKAKAKKTKKTKKAASKDEAPQLPHPTLAQFDAAMKRLKSDKATLTDFNACFKWLNGFKATPKQMKDEFTQAYKAKGFAYSKTSKKIIDPGAV